MALEPLAIKLRSHPDIRGIYCGDREHKCALFTDDRLMLLSSPVTSLPNIKPCAVLQLSLVLQSIIQKSVALNLADTVKSIQNLFWFKWQREALPYLGISLTPSLHTLYQANYPPLDRKPTVDILWWASNPSWYGRPYSSDCNPHV